MDELDDGLLVFREKKIASLCATAYIADKTQLAL
jgi:hypothetical protein